MYLPPLVTTRTHARAINNPGLALCSDLSSVRALLLGQLIASGARSVLAAAWDTADEPTRILAGTFYECLASEPVRTRKGSPTIPTLDWRFRLL